MNHKSSCVHDKGDYWGEKNSRDEYFHWVGKERNPKCPYCPAPAVSEPRLGEERSGYFDPKPTESGAEKVKLYSSFDIEREEVRTGNLCSWVKASDYKRALREARANALSQAADVADAKAKQIGLQFGCGQKDRHGKHYHDDRCKTFGEEILKLKDSEGRE